MRACRRNDNNPKKTVLRASRQLVVLDLAAALVAGCSSTSYEKAGSTSTSLQQAAKGMAESRMREIRPSGLDEEGCGNTFPIEIAYRELVWATVS